MNILLVEDDARIARLVQRSLEDAGLRVETAADGESGLRLARARPFRLIILDIMLPRRDGFSVCQQLRTEGDPTPILMLTARDAVDDKVRGLDSGADDYLPKPFDHAELMARVRALLRRDRQRRSRVIRIADLIVDTAARLVTRSGQEITLSPREYELLEALAANSPRVLSRDQIRENVWSDDESYSNTVDVYIGLLRRKVDSGYTQRLIQTIRGAGYALRPDEESLSANSLDEPHERTTESPSASDSGESA
jgi:DNA-binding response OmpR family regulator